MATKVKTSELPDNTGKLPYQDYMIQIIDVKQGHNVNKMCPQDILKLQIVGPEKVEVDGEMVTAAGREGDFYITYSNANLRRAKEAVLKLTGAPEPEEISIPSEDEVRSGEERRIPELQDLTLALKGRMFAGRWKTQPVYKTDTGKYDGKVMMDEGGAPIIVSHKLTFFDASDILTAVH